MKSPKETIENALNRELSRARDNIARAEMQLIRMPFDHDTRSTLKRNDEWEFDIVAALAWISKDPADDGPEISILQMRRDDV